MNTEFSYDVKIAAGADILKTGALAETLSNCGEVVITSKQYTDYAECESNMSLLLSTLSYIEAKLGTKKYYIINKVNPLEQSSDWDNFTVMRSYVAEQNASYNIFGQIRSNKAIHTLL